VQRQQAGNVPPAIMEVSNLFVVHRKAIEDALPKHLSPDRMMRIALTELRKTPKLMQCDMLSFLGAIIQASQLGLEPGGALGHAYLIPYGREVQMQIGYRGMVDLARRSGNISSLSARIVRDGDLWRPTFGTDEGIEHVPAFSNRPMTLAYAVAKMKDGIAQFDIMPKEEIDHIRDTYSKTAKSGPWVNEYEEMAKKTVVRRLFKMLPTSIEIRDAINIDENDDQQNARIIIPSYEVEPARLDPRKMEHLMEGQDAPIAGASAEADLKLARDEFGRVAMDAKNQGVDVRHVLGKSFEDAMKGDAKQVQVDTDLLLSKIQ
jgi:recombination protein RecT